MRNACSSPLTVLLVSCDGHQVQDETCVLVVSNSYINVFLLHFLTHSPDSVKERPDVFYLQPENSCHPSSSVWYSTQTLDASALDSMLSRVLAVRDVHLEPKQQQQQQPGSSEEDTS